MPVDAVRLPFPGDPRALARLARLFRKYRPGLVHTHLVHADFHGLPAAKAAGVPVLVSTKHGFNPFRSSRLFARADRTVGGLADAHVAISRGLARYLAAEEGFAEDAFTVIHYGIEPGPEPRPYADDVPRLLCVGRLIPIKGHDVLLRALAQARRVVPRLRLDVVGSGPLDEQLRAQAAELGLGDAVRFVGHVAPVPYEEGAIVVVPSLGEGFGMVALEAMEPRATGDRERRRRPARDRRARGDGPDRPGGRRRRWRGQSRSSQPICRAPPNSVLRGVGGRSRSSARSGAPTGMWSSIRLCANTARGMRAFGGRWRCLTLHAALTARRDSNRSQARSSANAASSASRKSNGAR